MSNKAERQALLIAQFHQQAEAVTADLLLVVQRHFARVGPHVTSHALIECLGSVLSAIATAAPAIRDDINVKLDQLRLYVATSNDDRPQ